MAIGSPNAIRKVVRTADGSTKLIFVDPNTGQEVANPTGYNIRESDNGQYYNFEGLNPLKDETEEQKSIAQSIIPQVQDVGGSNSTAQGGRPESRNASNNFGYMSKPDWMGYTGMVPGPIGMMGKAANLGVNANNMQAVNEARSMLGLGDLDTRSSIGALAKDRAGQVADVTIGDKNYSIGFEALSPDGRTNLTPNEARTRGLTSEEGKLSELSREQSKAAKDSFSKGEYGRDRGGLSGFAAEISSFIDSIFSDDNEDDGRNTSKTGLYSGEKSNTGIDYSAGFPDAPSAPAGSKGDSSSGGPVGGYSGEGLY